MKFINFFHRIIHFHYIIRDNKIIFILVTKQDVLLCFTE